MSLNVKSDRGKAILLRKAERADVLVENFRPNTMDRLSLSLTRIARVYPVPTES